MMVELIAGFTVRIGIKIGHIGRISPICPIIDSPKLRPSYRSVADVG